MHAHQRAGEEYRNRSSVSFPALLFVPEEQGSVSLLWMVSLFLGAGAQGRACPGSSSPAGTARGWQRGVGASRIPAPVVL